MNSLESKTSTIPAAPLADLSDNKTGTDSNEPKLGRWLILVIVLIVLALIFGFIPRFLHRQDLAKETTELAVSTVQVLHAIPGNDSAALLLPAELRPFEEAPIYARASGFIKRWGVDIGAQVKAGDLLADIDAPELEQQLSGARAELVQAEAAESLSRITAARWAELTKTSSVSEQENAEKQADLKLKTATVDAAKANVGRLEQLESFTHVTAPFAGILTARDIDVGDLISPGKEMFRLADTTKLRVFVRVPQSATPSIAMGVAAEIILPEKPSQKFLAKVVRTSGAIDTSSRTLLTELQVDNANGQLLSGSYAQVSFADLKQNPTLVLPANTLLFRAEGMQVGVVQPDGKVTLNNIVIGRDFGKSVEVLSGITAADQIIINPVDSLTAGTTVRVVDSTPSAKTK